MVLKKTYLPLTVNAIWDGSGNKGVVVKTRIIPNTKNIYSKSLGFGGTLFVLKNLEDWQKFYNGPIKGQSKPAPKPIIDFRSKMILAVEFQNCHDDYWFIKVCESPFWILVTVLDRKPKYECNSEIAGGDWVAVVVPNSNAPVFCEVYTAQDK